MTQIYRYQEIYKDLLKILDIQFLLPGTCPFEIPHAESSSRARGDKIRYEMSGN